MNFEDNPLIPVDHGVPLFRGPRGRSYLFPYSIMTVMFAIWAFAFSLLYILTRNFRDFLDISEIQTVLIPYIGLAGYLLSVIPAGFFIKKHGYKKGIIAGTLLYAAGSLLFFAAFYLPSLCHYAAFIFALVVLTGGLGVIDTSASPYICVLGPMETAEQRMNLAQSFKILGWIFGPVIGEKLVNYRRTEEWMELKELVPSYLVIGLLLLGVALLFMITRMPKPREERINGYGFAHTGKPLIKQDDFLKSIIALFFFYAAFTGLCSIFVRFTTELYAGLSLKKGIGPDMTGDLVNLVQNRVREYCAADLKCTIPVLAKYTFSLVAIGSYWLGCFLASIYLAFVKPERMLTLFTSLSIALLVVVIYVPGIGKLIALLFCFLFIAVIYPIAFPIGVKGLGVKIRMASPYLNLAVAGGTFTPSLMEYIANHHGTLASFYVPMACLTVVLAYGIDGYGIGQRLIRINRK